MSRGMAHISGGDHGRLHLRCGRRRRGTCWPRCIMTAPGSHPARQDVRARDRGAARPRARVKLEVERTDANLVGRGRARHRRRAAAGPQRGRHADLVPRPDRAASTRSAGWAAVGSGSRLRDDPRLRCSRPLALAHGRALEGRARRRRACSARAWCSNEFIAYSRSSGRMKADARPALVRDRHLRAVRLRELRLHRDPDRRHRRAWPPSARTTWPARPARADRGHPGQLHDRLHRGDAAVSAARRARRGGRGVHPRHARRCGPPSALVLGSGLGAFARQPGEADRASPTARSRTSPPPPPSATAASW